MKAFRFITFLVVTLSCSLLTPPAFAGTPPAGEDGFAITQVGSEWSLLDEVNGVQIFARRSECIDVMNGLYREFVLLKFVNTTQMPLKAGWYMELWYDELCRTCDIPNKEEYQYELDIPAGEAVEGSCDAVAQRELVLFLRFLNYPHVARLTKFNFGGMSINPR
jgi:hypothetical protein